MSTSQRRDFAKKQKQLRADTAERLEAIVEAAERAAEKVIDDAEAQARDYLAQARAEADRISAGKLAEVSDLVETLLGQATALQREAERLQTTLEGARTQLAADDPGAPYPQGAGDTREAQAPRLRALSGGGGEDRRGESTRADAAGARLLATQMAVSGSSREEIEQRLRKGFEIEDTRSILDAILGPED